MGKPANDRPVINRDPELRKLYWIWNSMIRRCHDQKTKEYARYGGRGIRVCSKWRASFWAFYDDMAPRPAGFLLDRIDNASGYEPANCRWLDYKGSNANRESCIYVDGVPLKEHMRRIGQLRRYRMVTKRISKGMPVAEALALPPRLWSGKEQRA